MSKASSADRLVAMANQIATFFSSKPIDQAEAEATDHVRQFWDPRMRAQFIEHLQTTGGEGLSPIALAIAKNLARRQAPTHDPATWTRKDSTEVDAG